MLTWGSDYPHAESTFPRSQTMVDTLLDGVGAAEREALTYGNAAALYGFPPVPAT
jgi:predicted TIM-barrel fold metal-dependent hydrolase